MTELRRVTITLPDHIDQKILEVRKDDQFVRCSYSEIARQLLDLGLKAYEKKRKKETA